MFIKDLQARQTGVEVEGDVIEMSDVREFSKFGKQGKVANAIIKDGTGKVKLSLWNEQIEKVKVGDVETKGTGGLVMVSNPPDAVLGQVLENTAFELGGYLNMAMVINWKVTYVLSQGRAFITG